VKEANANEQHKSIIGVLRAGAPTWEFKQMGNGGNSGSVVESDFYTRFS
jgi:hypothetical protein